MPKYSVRKPFTVLVGVVLILVLGYMSFTNMSTDFLPHMEMPYAVVMTSYPGASPEEVETAVSSPVESVMARINNVKNITSISNQDVSIVILEFIDGTDMNSTSIDMREALDQIKTYWDDSIGNPTIMKINPDMMPIMVAAIDYDGLSAAEVSKKASDNIIPEIESVGGVASVTASGQIEERIDVTLSDSKILVANKKVSDALEKKFADAEKKLQKGEDKITRGKDTLSDKKNEAADKMAEGSTKLNTAGTEINNGIQAIDAQIREIENQQKTLAESEKQSTEGLAVLRAQKKKLEATIVSLKKAKTSLEKTIDTLAKLDEKIEDLRAQIEAAGDADTSTLQGQLDAFLAIRQGVVSALEKEGIKEEELPTKLAEVKAGITAAETGLAEVVKQEKSLEAASKQFVTAKKKIKVGLAKLKAMREKLASGKTTTEKALQELSRQQILAGIEMSVAQASLNTGESELKKAKSEFKNTKKTAKESMDLTKLVTKDMIGNILKAQNFSMPAGYVEEDKISYLVKVGDKFTGEDDVRDLVILDLDIEGLDPIRLGDVADVAMTDNSDEVYTVLNGNPAVAVTMQKQSGFSTGDVTDAILERFESLEKQYEGLHMSVLMNQGMYIDIVVDAVIQNLLMGGVLAIFILLFFLWDIRPTIIVACSIPLSLVAAVVCMYFSGVTLNIISLSGLALGVGMLVDNSVVVIENIFRMRQEGMSVRRAAIIGAKQVGGAIIASTLTTICVFAPIIFTEGLTRQMFVDLGLTLAYTLVASLVIAMSLVPAMSSGMLRRQKKSEPRLIVLMQNAYVKMLRPILRFKWIVIPLSFGMLVLFAYLAVQRGTSMMPEMDSPQMTMTLTADEDKDFEDTKKLSDEALKRIQQIEDVELVGAMTGGNSLMTSLGGSGKNSVSMYAILKEDKEHTNTELKEMMLEKTKDIDATIDVQTSAMDMSMLTGSGVRVDIKGRDLDKLRSLSEEVMKKIGTVDGLYDITNEQEESGTEFRIRVDKAKAMRYSLTVAQVFAAVNAKVAEARSVATISTDTRDYKAYVRSDKDDSLTRDELKKMKIDYTDAQTQKKKSVKLEKIATFENVTSPNSIRRKNQSRYISVKASIEDGKIVDNIAADVDKQLETIDVPEGYTLEKEGENEQTQEAVKQVMLMMVLAVVLMYLIMVAQFQGLLSPFIILFTIPLAFTGGFMGLFLSGSDVSVISLIGFVMLSGIIVNNGIVLVDCANQLRTMGQGMDRREALIEAGRRRLRPILMTAITTVLGLTPMVFNKNMGSDMSRPMAIVVIGGLIYGTFLTLFIVPCMYEVLSRKKMRSMAEIEALENEVSDEALHALEMGELSNEDDETDSAPSVKEDETDE